MVAMVYSAVTNPFAGFGKAIIRRLEIIGYARAAAHLANHGYYDESKKCMLELAKLRD